MSSKTAYINRVRSKGTPPPLVHLLAASAQDRVLEDVRDPEAVVHGCAEDDPKGLVLIPIEDRNHFGA